MVSWSVSSDSIYSSECGRSPAVMDAEELLKRIRELEEGQAEFKQEVSELLTTTKTERRGGGTQCHVDSPSRRRTMQQQQPAVAPTASSRAPCRELIRWEAVSSKVQTAAPAAAARGPQRAVPPAPRDGHAVAGAGRAHP